VSDHLRNTNAEVSRWSRERRATIAPGGRVPLEWQAACIDLDALLVEIDGEPHLVGVAGRVWVQYDKVPFRIVSLVETKNPGEQRGTYVTFDLARRAGLSGYCVTLYDDHLHVLRDDGEERIFPNVPEFVRSTHVLRRRESA
jgi:hypothetical protein